MELLVLVCVLFNLVEGIVAESCSRSDVIYLNNNVKLAGSTFETSTGKGQTECARNCKVYGRCKSYNYHIGMKICELSFATAETGGVFVENEGFIYTNIDQWPDAMVLTCANHECKLNEVCVPGRKGYTCSSVANAEPMPIKMINAWQSSTSANLIAEKAIDGLTTECGLRCGEGGDCNAECTHTENGLPNIWSAQFQRVSSVYRVVMYLRLHIEIIERHQNYTILVGRTADECASKNGVEIAFYRGPPADIKFTAHTLNFIVANPPVGMCLIIKHDNPGNPMSLIEVLAYGFR